jgi:hypothetical protein
MRTTGEGGADAPGGVVALAFFILTAAFFITLPWDILVWLTGNENSWRHTGFMVPLASLAGIIVLALLNAAWNGVAALGAKAVKTVTEGRTKKPRAVKRKPPECPQERYKWANRLPPYDRDE